MTSETCADGALVHYTSNAAYNSKAQQTLRRSGALNFMGGDITHMPVDFVCVVATILGVESTLSLRIFYCFVS